MTQILAVDGDTDFGKKLISLINFTEALILLCEW